MALDYRWYKKELNKQYTCTECQKELSGRGKSNLCQKCRARVLMVDRWASKVEPETVLSHLDYEVETWLKNEVTKSKSSLSVMISSIIEDAYFEEQK